MLKTKQKCKYGDFFFLLFLLCEKKGGFYVKWGPQNPREEREKDDDGLVDGRRSMMNVDDD